MILAACSERPSVQVLGCDFSSLSITYRSVDPVPSQFCIGDLANCGANTFRGEMVPVLTFLRLQERLFV